MAQELGFADRVEFIIYPPKMCRMMPFRDVVILHLRRRHTFARNITATKKRNHGSVIRLATRGGWLPAPMMALQYAALKPGCFAIVNIADVKIKNKVYPLAQWTIDAAKSAGFEFVRREEFPLTRRFGSGMEDEVSTEPVLIFNKSDMTGQTPVLVQDG